MTRPRPTEEERLALCAWLTANGISPSTVPLDSSLSVSTADDGSKVIHYEEFVRTDDGHIQISPDGSGPWRRSATTPCKVEPPDGPPVLRVGR